MRTHIQGIAILGFLLAAIWGAVQLASPALSDAFGEDGALQADSGDDEDTVDLTVNTQPDEPLETREEIERLQFLLLLGGFFEGTDSVDGALGPDTRRAMSEAADEWGLEDPTDRELFEHAEELLGEQQFLPG